MKAEDALHKIMEAANAAAQGATGWAAAEQALRSYGLACALAEREANDQAIANLNLEDQFQDSGDDVLEAYFYTKAMCMRAIRSRPVGDELMKEIEG